MRYHGAWLSKQPEISMLPAARDKIGGREKLLKYTSGQYCCLISILKCVPSLHQLFVAQELIQYCHLNSFTAFLRSLERRHKKKLFTHSCHDQDQILSYKEAVS